MNFKFRKPFFRCQRVKIILLQFSGKYVPVYFRSLFSFSKVKTFFSQNNCFKVYGSNFFGKFGDRVVYFFWPEATFCRLLIVRWPFSSRVCWFDNIVISCRLDGPNFLHWWNDALSLLTTQLSRASETRGSVGCLWYSLCQVLLYLQYIFVGAINDNVYIIIFFFGGGGMHFAWSQQLNPQALHIFTTKSNEKSVLIKKLT
jgi:hypothetical protein